MFMQIFCIKKKKGRNIAYVKGCSVLFLKNSFLFVSVLYFMLFFYSGIFFLNGDHFNSCIPKADFLWVGSLTILLFILGSFQIFILSYNLCSCLVILEIISYFLKVKFHYLSLNSWYCSSSFVLYFAFLCIFRCHEQTSTLWQQKCTAAAQVNATYIYHHLHLI
jgi:hypothetical protein